MNEWKNFTKTRGRENAAILTQTILYLAQNRTQGYRNDLYVSRDVFKTIETLQTFERRFEEYFWKVGGDLQKKMSSSAAADMQRNILRRSIGPVMWEHFAEIQVPGKADQRVFLWRYVDMIRVDDFLRKVSQMRNVRTNYPLLAIFIQNEERLTKLKYIGAILEWHNVLFDILQSSEINRDEARAITNREILKRIPGKVEFERAEGVLKEYCIGFNEAFPLVENLYECQRNPFLTEDGEVDIDGPMSPDTPIIFSLPSMTQGQNEAAGLCTVQLLLHLHRLHDELVTLGNREVQTEEGEENQEQVPVAQNRDFSYEISYLTPSDILQQKLVTYDRLTDLLPLLHASADQSLECGGDQQQKQKKAEITYNYRQIESGIRSQVLKGKQSIRLHIRQYQYRGDIRSTGRVSGLRRRIPQESLPNLVLENICKEFERQDFVLKFMSRLVYFKIYFNFLKCDYKIGLFLISHFLFLDWKLV